MKSSDVIQLTQEQTRRLIKLHRKHECLWNYYSPDYKKVEKKQRTWEFIASEFGSTVDQIKKKMKYLRAAYLIEKKKVDNSKRSDSKDEVYEPNLYYYHDLDYVRSVVVTRKRRPSFDMDPILTGDNYTNPDSPAAPPPLKANKIESEESRERAKNSFDIISQCSSTENSGDFVPHCNTTTNNSLHQTKLANSRSAAFADDPCEAFARNVAHKLRHMNKLQRLVAEKIINETLFYGELELLTVPFASQFGTSIETFNQMDNASSSAYPEDD